ncbi:hypothetical protein MINT15_00810 [Saccharomonospora viridis]|uniref:Uncharacterized protein n=1 Tax=Saccharomonospora viridis TaxID=1852 RepID=A0A837DEC2_9PSEU|nr:hypothetical protein MINT15_00810 [Saccharomonospora viridis]
MRRENGARSPTCQVVLIFRSILQTLRTLRFTTTWIPGS